MKSYFVRFFLLTVLVTSFSISYAQSSKEIIKQKVEIALRTHIKKIYPPKSCPKNDMAFFYKNDFKFTKNMQVGKTLRLWGAAATTYRNSRTGGKATVLFYVEVNKIGGEITVSKLKWQTGKCMKFETLFEI